MPIIKKKTPRTPTIKEQLEQVALKKARVELEITQKRLENMKEPTWKRYGKTLMSKLYGRMITCIFAIANHFLLVRAIGEEVIKAIASEVVTQVISHLKPEKDDEREDDKDTQPEQLL